MLPVPPKIIARIVEMFDHGLVTYGGAKHGMIMHYNRSLGNDEQMDFVREQLRSPRLGSADEGGTV